MADANQLKQAQAVYETMRGMFDARELAYEADDEKLTVYSGAKGDDLPVAIRMRIDPERMLIVVHSLLPFETPQDRRLAMSVAVSRVNYGLPDGSFDFDGARNESPGNFRRQGGHGTRSTLLLVGTVVAVRFHHFFLRALSIKSFVGTK